MNLDNFEMLIDKLRQQPEEAIWMDGYHNHCQSAHCIAGWSQILASKGENPLNAWDDGQEFLGLETVQSVRLFAMEYWPARFRNLYSINRKKATLARLKHFIETDGRE